MGWGDHGSDAPPRGFENTPDPEEQVASGGVKPALEGWHGRADLGPPGAAALGMAGLRGARKVEADPDSVELAFESRLSQEPAPSPRNSGLLTDFLPFDRSGLAEAIEQFLAEFEGLGAELADWQSSTGVLPALATVTVAVVASELARRRSRGAQPEASAAEEDEGLARSLGFPGTWSFADP
jgi:hypothetical protein